MPLINALILITNIQQVFITKFKLLQSIGDFPRACQLLLEFIECSALSKSNEVSLAALKSFQEILYNKPINQMKVNGEDDELWNVSKILFMTSLLLCQLKATLLVNRLA